MLVMILRVSGYNLTMPILYGQKISDINYLLKKIAGVEITGVLKAGVWQTRMITAKNLENGK